MYIFSKKNFTTNCCAPRGKGVSSKINFVGFPHVHKVLFISNSENSITLGAETFASRKIREIFAFREHKLSRIDRKVEFFVVLWKRLDPRRNKREKTVFFQLLYYVLFSVSSKYSYINQSPVKIEKIKQRYINASFLTNL